MSVKVEVNRSVLDWAVQRSGVDRAKLDERFPRLGDWERGDAQPTFRQLEKLASATRTAVGLLLLEQPPVDTLPLADFRIMGGGPSPTPSPDLLDTIALCERRQEWYRVHLIEAGNEPLRLVASATLETPPAEVAEEMSEELDFGVNHRAGRWQEALTTLMEHVEEAGILVMVSGIVGSNTTRPLDTAEFRGFTLVDRYAPLVFINGTDTKAAQIFTLAHELAHIWLGESGVDNAEMSDRSTTAIEKWCNAVAAEFLAPTAEMAAAYDPEVDPAEQLERLARVFKVSTLVVLRRLADIGLIAWPAYRKAYAAEHDRVMAIIGAGGTSGGSFYNTQPRRVSKPFARAVLASTLAGDTTYAESFRLIGTRKPTTLHELAARMGVA